jgi:uncharacterized membrane protein
MTVLESRMQSMLTLLDHSGFWMVQNSVLAWIPVALAIPLFRVWERGPRRPRRTPVWWAGLVLFVLFLPNAPYVVTDLVHLRADVHRLGPDGPVATTVLPVYGLLVASGFLAYYLALAQVGHYLGRIGQAHRRALVFLGLHGVVAVGILLGRWSRLNSWEPVLGPRDTISRIVDTLAWSAAPVLIVTLFVVTAVGHFVTKAVVEATWASLTRALDRLRSQPAA